MLRFQVREISAAQLQPGEDEAVGQEFTRASNAAKLLQLSQAALDALSENENSLLTQAGAIGRTLQELQRVDAGAASLAGTPFAGCRRVRELQAELSRYAEKVDVDPARLAALEERLNLIHSLKRKYGATLGGSHRVSATEAKSKLQSLEGRDAELARLNGDLEKLDAEILRAGKKLSAARKKVIPQLARAAGKQLGDLGFKQSKFDVAMRSCDARRRAWPRRHRRAKNKPATRRRLHLLRRGRRSYEPALTRLNSSSRPIPASRPSRSAPSRRPAKWRA